MTIDRIYFDIETGPEPYRVIENIVRYEDDDEPKIGNATKPETIERKIREWNENKEQRKKKFFWKTQSRAALNPLLGRVIGVGYHRESFGDTVVRIDTENEAQIITELLSQMGEVTRRGGLVVTYNGDSFDLPFLANRAAILGIDVGNLLSCELFSEFGKTPNSFVDLAKVWLRYGSGYSRSYDLPKFEELCSAFGIEAKTQGFRGDKFHVVAKENKIKAIDYLTEDVEALRQLAERLIKRI